MSRILQRCGVLVVGVFVLSLMNPFGGAVNVAAGDSRYFPETGQTSSNAFYEFWLNHGQTEILGLPITPAYTRKDGTLQQIFERAIMEWHPENPQPNRVQLQLLGHDDLDDIETGRATGSVDHRTINPRPCAPGANCKTFAATNHTTVGSFRDFWYAHGRAYAFSARDSHSPDFLTLDAAFLSLHVSRRETRVKKIRCASGRCASEARTHKPCAHGGLATFGYPLSEEFGRAYSKSKKGGFLR